MIPYKSREIPDEVYYLIEKFNKKPKIAIMLPPQGVRGAKAPRMVAKFHFLKRFKVLENESIYQWKCRCVGGIFSGGGTLRPYKGYHRTPTGGPGGEGPSDGREVSFFQTIQSIRKWILFSKSATFFLPKNPFFSKKTFEKLRNFWIFSKDYFKIFNFYDNL